MIRILTLIFCLIAFSNAANAAFIDPTNCYFSNELFGNQREDYVLRPVNAECSNICVAECNVYSRLDGSGNELNDDIINKCLTACQAGQGFSSKYRTGVRSSPNHTQSDYTWSTDDPLSSNQTPSISHRCPTDSASVIYPGNNALETSFTVSVGDSFQIRLQTPPSGYVNELMLCGQATTEIEPPIITFDEGFDGWDWGSNKNYNIRNFHARNDTFTDTGVDIKNGDYINISYSGEYCTGADDDDARRYGLFIRSSDYTSSWSVLNRAASSMFSIQGNTNKQLLEPTNFLSKLSSSSIQSIPIPYNRYEGGSANSYNHPSLSYCVINKTTTLANVSGVLSNISNQFFRLAISNTDAVPTQSGWFDDNLGGHKVKIKRKGCYYNDGSRVQYAVSNQTANASGAAVFSPPNDDAAWIDIPQVTSTSPQVITVNQNGKLFLRIKPYCECRGMTIGSTGWTNCQNSCANSYLKTAPTNVACSNLSGDAAQNCNAYTSLQSNINNVFAPSNSFGQYFVFLKKLGGSASSFVEPILSTPILIIRNYLFGDDPVNGCTQATINLMNSVYNLDCGLAPKIFKRLVQDSGYIGAIRALIVFYFAFSALSFFIGLSPITQQEAITRLLKLSIVITLISDNSWDFFNRYLFQFFTDGSLELLREITIVTLNDNSITYQSLVNSPGQMFFGYFDLAITLILSNVLWCKIVAVLLSSFFGIFIVIVIIKAIFNISMSVLKALIVYLVSLLGIGILFMLAPFFISFMLFKSTQDMFVAWLKQLLVFALQPVVVMAGMMILNNLVILAINATFAFSVCKACYFGIYIPFIDKYICFFSAYTTISAPFNPTPFAIPMELITACFCLSITAGAMNAFTDFSSKLVSMIVLRGGGIDYGRAYGGGASGVFEAANPVSVFQHLIFQDKETKQARKTVSQVGGSIKSFFGGGNREQGRRRRPGQNPGGGAGAGGGQNQ